MDRSAQQCKHCKGTSHILTFQERPVNFKALGSQLSPAITRDKSDSSAINRDQTLPHCVTKAQSAPHVAIQNESVQPVVIPDQAAPAQVIKEQPAPSVIAKDDNSGSLAALHEQPSLPGAIQDHSLLLGVTKEQLSSVTGDETVPLAVIQEQPSLPGASQNQPVPRKITKEQLSSVTGDEAVPLAATQEETPPPDVSQNQSVSLEVTKEQPFRDVLSYVESEVITDSKSQFQGFGASVKSIEDVHTFIQQMKDTPKCSIATHNIFAYTLSQGPSGCRDDGEEQAGGKVLRMMQQHGVEDTVIVVSRWYGGQHIGNRRFTHIANAARQTLEKLEMRYAIPVSNRFSHLSTTGIDKDNQCNEDMQYPRLDHEPIDHMLIHHSTGKKLSLNRLYNQGERSRKQWAGYFQEARNIIESGPCVKHSVTIMCGIRDVRQQLEGWNSGSIVDLLSSIVDVAKRRSPEARVVFVSLAPCEDPKTNTEIMNVNEGMQSVAKQNHNVEYCDIFGWLSELNGGAQNGPHVKPKFLGRVSGSIRRSLGYTKPTHKVAQNGSLTANMDSSRTSKQNRSPAVMQGVSPSAAMKQYSVPEANRDRAPPVHSQNGHHPMMAPDANLNRSPPVHSQNGHHPMMAPDANLNQSPPVHSQNGHHPMIGMTYPWFQHSHQGYWPDARNGTVAPMHFQHVY